MSRVIVTVSGGKASAWCAGWALRKYPKKDVVLYFNDTKWEHPDLYRFLDDLSQFLDHPIHTDSDGRDPESLFYDYSALANNRMPFCSKVLKAERLQRFFRGGDTLVFGIGPDEPHRATRIAEVYRSVAQRTGKYPIVRFPLISEKVTKQQIEEFLEREPVLKSLYFIGWVFCIITARAAVFGQVKNTGNCFMKSCRTYI